MRASIKFIEIAVLFADRPAAEHAQIVRDIADAAFDLRVFIDRQTAVKKDKSKEEILKDTGCTVGVKDANLSINEGEFFVIMGLSGSGKSTLLRCINRLIRPTTGQVLVNGVDISKISEKELLQVRRKELAMVFQNFGLLPHRSVLSNIAFGLELQGVKKEEREKKAMESMKLVGLKG